MDGCGIFPRLKVWWSRIMNEFSALMYLLTREGDSERGASEDELLKVLHLPERIGKAELQKKLMNFDSYVQTLGLRVRNNLLDGHWFVTFSDEVTNLTAINPFANNPRLAATLLATIICAFKFGNQIPSDAIQEVRQKKSVQRDLNDLEKLYYLEIAGDIVSLTPLIGYQLDLFSLFDAINQQVTGNPHDPE